MKNKMWDITQMVSVHDEQSSIKTIEWSAVGEGYSIVAIYCHNILWQNILCWWVWLMYLHHQDDPVIEKLEGYISV